MGGLNHNDILLLLQLLHLENRTPVNYDKIIVLTMFFTEDSSGYRTGYPPHSGYYPPFAYFNPASYPVSPQYPLKHQFIGVTSHSFSAARPLKSEPKRAANKAINIKKSYRDWRNRPFLNRYDSDDSGIAESPKSMTSSVTWTSLDESSSDECKSLERKTKLSSTDEEVFEDNRPEAKIERQKVIYLIEKARIYFYVELYGNFLF